jgi:hypothetical protein
MANRRVRANIEIGPWMPARAAAPAVFRVRLACEERRGPGQRLAREVAGGQRGIEIFDPCRYTVTCPNRHRRGRR